MGTCRTEKQLNTGPVGGTGAAWARSEGWEGETFSDYLEWLNDAEPKAAGAGDPPLSRCEVCAAPYVGRTQDEAIRLCDACDDAADRAEAANYGQPSDPEHQDCVHRAYCQRLYANVNETGFCDMCGPRFCDRYVPYVPTPEPDLTLCQLCHKEPAANASGLCAMCYEAAHHGTCKQCGAVGVTLSDEGLCQGCHYGGIPSEAKLMCLNCGEQFGTLLPDWFDICVANDVAAPCLCPACSDTLIVQGMAEGRCQDSGCFWAKNGPCVTKLDAGQDPYTCPAYVVVAGTSSMMQSGTRCTWHCDEDNHSEWLKYDHLTTKCTEYRVISNHQLMTEIPEGCATTLPDGQVVIPVMQDFPEQVSHEIHDASNIMFELRFLPGYDIAFSQFGVLLMRDEAKDRYLYAVLNEEADQINLYGGPGRGVGIVERLRHYDVQVCGNADCLTYLSLHKVA